MKYLSFILAILFLISCGGDSFPKRYINNELASYDSKAFVWKDNGPAEEIELSEVSFSNQLNDQYFEQIYLADLRANAAIVEEFTLEDECSFNMKQTVEGEIQDTTGKYTLNGSALIFDLFPNTTFVQEEDGEDFLLCVQLIAYASGNNIPVLDTRLCTDIGFDAILQAEKDRFDYQENDTIVIFLPTIEYIRGN